MREKKPEVYVRVVADLLPKEANINVEAGDEVGDRVVPRAALALDGDAFPAGANFPQYRVGWRTPGGATEKDLRRRTYRGPRTHRLRHSR